MRLFVLFILLTIQYEVFGCCFCTHSWLTLNTDSLSSHSVISIESRSPITKTERFFYVLQSNIDRVPLNIIGKHNGDGVYSVFLKPSRNLIEGEKYYFLEEDSIDRVLLKKFKDTTKSIMDYLEKKYYSNNKVRLSSKAIINIMEQDSGYNPYGYADIIYSTYKLPYERWVASKTPKNKTMRLNPILYLKEITHFKERDGFKQTQNFAKFTIKKIDKEEKGNYSFEFHVKDITLNKECSFFESKNNLKIGSFDPCGGNFKLEKNHTYKVTLILHDAYNGSKTKLNPIEFTWSYD